VCCSSTSPIAHILITHLHLLHPAPLCLSSNAAKDRHRLQQRTQPLFASSTLPVADPLISISRPSNQTRTEQPPNAPGWPNDTPAGLPCSLHQPQQSSLTTATLTYAVPASPMLNSLHNTTLCSARLQGNGFIDTAATSMSIHPQRKRCRQSITLQSKSSQPLPAVRSRVLICPHVTCCSAVYLYAAAPSLAAGCSSAPLFAATCPGQTINFKRSISWVHG
jgi:hypothetical protein